MSYCEHWDKTPAQTPITAYMQSKQYCKSCGFYRRVYWKFSSGLFEKWHAPIFIGYGGWQENLIGKMGILNFNRFNTKFI